jgi:hypothetical protein
MKKIISIICVMVVFASITACNSDDSSVTEEESQVNDNSATEGDVAQDETLMRDDSIFETAIAEGVITAEEAAELMIYMEANDPKNGDGDIEEGPFVGAAAEGIITEEQAELLTSMIDLTSGVDGTVPDMDGESGPGTTSSDMMSIEEANALEAELLEAVGYTAAVDGYPIVDTNQTTFYSNDGIIDEPAEGDAFYGQDASYTGNAPSYTDNGDGTITDNVTGLIWQQDPGEKLDWETAVNGLDAFNEEALGGYTDWRIPTMKELYSLVDFSGYTRTSSDTSNPYIDTDYFVFAYGDEAGEPRFIDSQILTSTIYDSDTLGGNTTVFGYNFADGRIKGYEISKEFYCYHVRGNTNYGVNLFVDNGDETITDEATSLMWTQNDSGYYEAGTESDGTLNWEEALAWVQEMNEAEFLGYSDWRLPNIKELQSIVDYTKSPITTDSPAIDDLFYCTPIINCFGEDDYGYYWSGTTHDDTSASTIEYNAASYVVFGNAMGLMDNEEVDAHGSGSQKSDPKTGDREDYPAPDENAPQGDEQRVYNMVRLVRDAD